MVKLSSDEQAILAMKSMYANGSNYREICELFEITPPTLYQHVKEERSRQREKYERTKREFVEFLNSKLGFRGAVSWRAKIVGTSRQEISQAKKGEYIPRKYLDKILEKLNAPEKLKNQLVS